MAEVLRSITIRVEVDTNKNTYVYEADQYDAAEVREFIDRALS